MSLHDVIETSYQTLHDHASSVRLILLHPRSRYRSALVARIVNDAALNPFYYAMGPDDVNVPAFLGGLMYDLANQHPTFGRHISQLRYDEVGSDMDALADAFLKDLDELSDEPFVLVLDEYDQSDNADDLQSFIEHVVPMLPDRMRLLINSRTLPRLPWVSLIAQNRAVMLRDDSLVSDDFYETVEDGSPKLEVYALGPGYVLLDGKPIDTWEGHLPRLLFFFALDRPVVTRAEICQSFWTKLTTDQAVNVFHVTKRRLHKALGFDVLVHDKGYYRINPEISIKYDAVEFVQALVGGRTTKGKDISAWQRAIELYRGPFLQGHTEKWIDARRKDFQAGYLEALIEMARYYMDEGRTEHALGLYVRALGEDYTREDLHRIVMRLYADLGRRTEAAVHYKKLLGVNAKPEAETQELYQTISKD